MHFLKHYIPEIFKQLWVMIAFSLDVLGIVTSVAGAVLIPLWVWVTFGLSILVVAQSLSYYKTKVELDKLKSSKNRDINLTISYDDCRWGEFVEQKSSLSKEVIYHPKIVFIDANFFPSASMQLAKLELDIAGKIIRDDGFQPILLQRPETHTGRFEISPSFSAGRYTSKLIALAATQRWTSEPFILNVPREMWRIG